MPNQHRLGDGAAESAGLSQPDYDRDQMNQKDDEITHPGNDSSTAQFIDGESIQQFAMDTLETIGTQPKAMPVKASVPSFGKNTTQ